MHRLLTNKINLYIVIFTRAFNFLKQDGTKRSSSTKTRKTSSSTGVSARSSSRSHKGSAPSLKSKKERIDQDHDIKLTILQDSLSQGIKPHIKYVMSARSQSSEPLPVINIKQTGSISQAHSSIASTYDTSKQLSVSEGQREKDSGSRKKITKIAILVGLLTIFTLIVTLVPMSIQRIIETDSIFGYLETEFFGSSTSLTSDGKMLAVGGHKLIRVYSDIGDKKNKEWVPIVDLSSFMSGDYFSSYSEVVLSSNGSHLIAGDPDSNEYGDNSGSVSVFKVGVNWRKIGIIHGKTPYSQFGHSVDISDDGTRIISTSVVGSVYFYKLENGRWQEQGHFEKVGNVASISGDGKLMAVGNGKANLGAGRVSIYDLETLTLIASKDGNVDLIRLGNSIAFSNDGSTVAVGMAYDLTIELSLGRPQSSFVSVYRLDTTRHDLVEYGC